VWVQVIAEDGSYGLGQCNQGEPVAALIDYVIAPLLEGEDVMAIEKVNDIMWRAAEMYQGGLASYAQSGVDIALWDLKGKLLERPVYELLGGPSRKTVDLYTTTDEVEWALELGFKRVKIGNPFFYEDGTEGLKRLEEHVASARETAGDDIELMINPVSSYNTEMAIRVAERLRPYKLRWIEEPLPAWNLEGYKDLKKSMTWTALATGEHHYGRKAFQQLIAARAVDIVQPDIQWTGGLSEVMKIYTYAEAAGIETIAHMGGNTAWGQHFSLAMPETQMAEWFMFTNPGQPLHARQTPGVPIAQDGKVVPSDAPGFGLEIKDEWITPWDHSAAARR
jgi:L-rhamnonate dehydratase